MPDRLLGESGFTLVELAIILVIVGILATLAVPTYRQAVVKAQEAVLKQNLFTLREMLDQYRADKGRFPQSLSDLVAQGYLRAVPLDPLTRSATTWQEIMDEVEEGVLDVHSASTLVATNGIPYNEW
ncbi:type IV pilin protein [Nitrospira sp. Nam80]